jgi:hypothetical protein
VVHVNDGSLADFVKYTCTDVVQDFASAEDGRLELMLICELQYRVVFMSRVVFGGGRGISTDEAGQDVRVNFPGQCF